MREELICVSCPMGCAITVEYNEKEVTSVKGNECKRGETYAKKEVFSPERMVTTTVKINGAAISLVPVKTDNPVPKNKMFDIMDAASQVTLNAPVNMGDVVIKNVMATGVNLVATRSLTKV